LVRQKKKGRADKMTKIYYKEGRGKHSFYMLNDRKEYYLFTQSKRKGVGAFYRGGVTLDRAINHGIGRRDRAIHQTMDKLIRNIKYIEEENDIVVLKKTGRKAA